jgi:uncharacterized membrane-anchored protein
MIALPPDYAERQALAAEVHARPYETLTTPERASFLAVLVDADARGRERAHLDALCAPFGVAPPPADAIHFSAQLGALRMKWERHSEFSTYTLFLPGQSATPFSEPPFSALPAGWLAAIPGQTLYAAHAKLVAMPATPLDAAALAAHFGTNIVVGGELGEGAGLVVTDFHMHADGCARFLVLDRSFTPRQAGRMLQRLFEIEAYRMMAMLALPVARRDAARITAIERSLASLTDEIAREDGADEKLLGELTRLAADVERMLTASQFRYAAGHAYYDLVRTRIAELRERRVPGLQTIDEFMSRRLAPAMATCESVAARLRRLSERVAQTSALLSTRVEIARERQNQALLGQMNRRAQLQLRLQQTVEGLSVAAVTYYVVGLVGYAAKGLKAGGLHVDPDIAIGVAIPIVAVLIALAVRRARRKLGEVARPPA